MEQEPKLTPEEELAEAERRIDNPTDWEDIKDFFGGIFKKGYTRQKRLDAARARYREQMEIESLLTSDIEPLE